MFELIWGLGNRPPGEVIRDGMQAAHAAIALDSYDEDSHANLGMLLRISGDHDGALREGKAALTLNANKTYSQMVVGAALGYSGAENHGAAMEHLNYAVRVGPRDLNIHWSHAFTALFSMISGKYPEAVEHAHTAIRLNPINGTAHRILAAALARDGQTEAAKTAWARAWKVQPLDLPGYTASLHRMFRHDEEADKFIEGMRLAGAPFERSLPATAATPRA